MPPSGRAPPPAPRTRPALPLRARDPRPPASAREGRSGRPCVHGTEPAAEPPPSAQEPGDAAAQGGACPGRAGGWRRPGGRGGAARPETPGETGEARLVLSGSRERAARGPRGPEQERLDSPARPSTSGNEDKGTRSHTQSAGASRGPGRRTPRRLTRRAPMRTCSRAGHTTRCTVPGEHWGFPHGARQGKRRGLPAGPHRPLNRESDAGTRAARPPRPPRGRPASLPAGPPRLAQGPRARPRRPRVAPPTSPPRRPHSRPPGSPAGPLAPSPRPLGARRCSEDAGRPAAESAAGSRGQV
ncbi:translation initiation factor IF-2 isoform X3 [Mustela putorius furo]|uniref:Translation initiation factor IF-2 isoform X3 n=1 Tax=Mustela putorius furo TaxID=9669 RepID=A0A8U0SGA5_MUSPF|nr:translation initiation factor IF-2 isoform X3 [Mustela putorius furo]